MSGKFKVGDWVIATTAADQRYSITTPGSVGVVMELDVAVGALRDLMEVKFYYYTSNNGGATGYVYEVSPDCFDHINTDTLPARVKAKIVQALFSERNGTGDEE